MTHTSITPMLRKILISASFLLSAIPLFAAGISGVVADTVPAVNVMPADTLLNVSKASTIDINSDGSSTQITVRSLDDTEDNFYYDTQARKKTTAFSRFQIQCNDISDVLVVESEKDVNVSYKDAEGNPRNYNFLFPDPENRSQKSYIGNRWSDFAINLSGGRPVKWQIVTMGLSLGWVTPTNASPHFEPSMGRSVELSWIMVMGVQMTYRSFSIATGLGIDARNFVTKGDRFFFKNPDGRITLEPYSEEMTNRRSRINVFSLEVPVLCSLNFGRHRQWGVTAGPVVNFNTSANLKTQYKIGDKSYEITTGKISQRPVTVDMLFAIHYSGVGIYARYSQMNMLKKSTGMDFGAFSTGISLLF